MNQNENFTPIHLRDREKFERLKAQAELKAAWAQAWIDGAPFERECRSHDGDGWMPVLINHGAWNDWIEYRRKPEPTLAERNAALSKRWNAMKDHGFDKTGFPVREEHGCLFVCEILYADTETWRRCAPVFASLEYRIVPLPSPRIEPFTRDTCPLGAHVTTKLRGARAIVTGASENTCEFGLHHYYYEQALADLDLIPDPSKPDERRPFGREVAP